MDATTELTARHKCFGGVLEYHRHHSQTCGTEMRFAVFIPPVAAREPAPVLTYLAGLTCTEETFMIKAGAPAHAAAHGLILVAPDTSPRGAGVAGEDDDWDLGTGAGFYVDATALPWAANYRMYSYVTVELPQIIAANFPARIGQQGIFGHSMGGHGALVCALKNPHLYASVSAFAPICAPMRCPWGEKAFTAYLGPDRESWREWDASELVAGAEQRPSILIDQGGGDEFLEEQLYPEVFQQACADAGQPLQLRRHDDYDHGYYFIASFVGEHIAHHAAALRGQPSPPQPVFS